MSPGSKNKRFEPSTQSELRKHKNKSLSFPKQNEAEIVLLLLYFAEIMQNIFWHA